MHQVPHCIQDVCTKSGLRKKQGQIPCIEYVENALAATFSASQIVRTVIFVYKYVNFPPKCVLRCPSRIVGYSDVFPLPISRSYGHTTRLLNKIVFLDLCKMECAPEQHKLGYRCRFYVFVDFCRLQRDFSQVGGASSQ